MWLARDGCELDFFAIFAATGYGLTHCKLAASFLSYLILNRKNVSTVGDKDSTRELVQMNIVFNVGQFWPFCLLYIFSHHNSCSNWKSIDGVLGIQTWDLKIGGAEGSTKLWQLHNALIKVRFDHLVIQPPNSFKFIKTWAPPLSKLIKILRQKLNVANWPPLLKIIRVVYPQERKMSKISST